MIKLNGKNIEKDCINLLTLIEEEKFNIQRIAVELNGKIVKKQDYKNIVLHSGDIVEIVSFVGGG